MKARGERTWFRQALFWLHAVRRLNRQTITAFVAVQRPIRFHRSTVWTVTHRPHEPRGLAVPADLPNMWGDLDGQQAEPAQAGAVALLRRVSPPSKHASKHMVDWDAVHKRIGARLPQDYRDLIDDRGAGLVAGIVVRGPGAGRIALDLEEWLLGFARTVSDLRGLTCEHYPPPFYPETGGMLPWGEDENGHIIAWAPSTPDPDRWPVAVLSPEWHDLELHRLTATSYLLSRLPGPRLLASTR